MRTLLKTVFFSTIIAIMFFSLSYAIEIGGPKTPAPTPPVQPKVPEKTLTVPDNPQIREFSINPATIVQGGQVNLIWRVDPSPGGSPITEVRITVGAIEIHRSSSGSGEHRVNLPSTLEPRPSWLFVLTATNQIRRSSTRTFNLSIIADNPVIQEFSSEPRTVRAGAEFRLRWRVEPPPGGSRITSVRIEPDVTGILSSTGEQTIRIDRSASTTRKRYTLTATNQTGRSMSRTLDIDILSLDTIMSNIRVYEINMSPRQLNEDVAGDFTFRVSNENRDITLSGVAITLIADEERRMSYGRIVGALYGQTLSPGDNLFRIRGVISQRGVSPKPRFLAVQIRFADQTLVASTSLEVRTITIESYEVGREGFGYSRY